MTVDELISQIAAIYPRAGAEAIKAMKPVYHAHLDRFAGEDLRAAAEEVFGGAFKPTVGEPFPKPAEFKAVLVTRVRADTTKSIREDLEARNDRHRIGLQNWLNGQGLRIREARHDMIYRACLDLAIAECSRPSWRHLTAEQIKLCEHRALSQERVRRFGALPKTNDAHWVQIEAIAEGWNVSLNRADWLEKTRAGRAP